MKAAKDSPYLKHFQATEEKKDNEESLKMAFLFFFYEKTFYF